MGIVFSIIIPTYNVERYIPRCLDSILSQSYPNFEVICVDDASCDGTLDILEEYSRKDSRVIVKRQERNSGVSEARNTGIEAASGDYIWLVDSDDFIKDGALERMVQETEDRKWDFINFAFCYYNPAAEECTDARCPSESVFPSGWQYYEECSPGSCFGPVWNHLFSREFILSNKLRFDKSLHYYEDTLFTIMACCFAGPVKTIGDVLYVYRSMREGSAMTNFNDLRFRNMAQVSNALFSFVNDKDVGRDVIYRTIASFYRRSIFMSSKGARLEIMNVVDWHRFKASSSYSVKGLMMYAGFRYFPRLSSSFFKRVSSGW